MKSPPYLSLQHYPDQGMIQSQFQRSVDSAEYRQSLLSICDLLHKTQASYWLVDFNKSTTPTISDQNWTTFLMSSHLMKSNIRKIALVIPNDLFLELVVEKVSTSIMSLTENKIQIARFSNRNVAQQWLTSRSDLEGLFKYDEPMSA